MPLRQCGKHAAMRRTHYGHFKCLVAFYAAEHIGYGYKRRICCGGIIVAECPKWIKLKRSGFGCRLGRFTLPCRRGREGTAAADGEGKALCAAVAAGDGAGESVPDAVPGAKTAANNQCG